MQRLQSARSEGGDRAKLEKDVINVSADFRTKSAGFEKDRSSFNEDTSW